MKVWQRYKNFLLDCDGVVWHSSTAIEGSAAAIKRLREQGKNVVFITNNSTKTREMYAEKFAALGFEGVKPESVNTSGSAVAEYCAHKAYRKVFAIGEAGLVRELEAHGVQVLTDEGGEAMSDEEFERTTVEPGVEAVTVGWDRTFSYRKLCLASLYLQQGAELVATNPDSSDRVGGRAMPGNGCAVAAIQYSVDDPQGSMTAIVGKPNQGLLQRLLDKYGFEPSETLMVGDRLDTDIKFAAGMVDSMLVLSGCTSEGDPAIAHVRPTLVAPDLARGVDLEVPEPPQAAPATT